MLKSANADPNFILPSKGIAPIHFAVGIEQLKFAEEATKLFLSNGADPNVRAVDGQTPVHIAAAWGRINILYHLLANGGDPWLKDNDSKNAFDYAYKEEHWDIIALLEQFENGDTYSKVECSKTDLAFEKLIIHKGNTLLEYGANAEGIIENCQIRCVGPQTDLPNQLYETIKYSKEAKPQECYVYEGRGSKHNLRKPHEASKKKNETENKEKLFLRNKYQENNKLLYTFNSEKLLNNDIKKINEMKCKEKTLNVVGLSDNSASSVSVKIHPLEGSARKQFMHTTEEERIQNLKLELDTSNTVLLSDEQTASHSCFSYSEDKNPFLMQFIGVKSCACVTEHLRCNHRTCACISFVNNSNADFKKLNLEEDSDKVLHSSSGSETDFSTQQNYETAPECSAESQAYISVSEEYSCTDREKGVTLLERRLLVPTLSFSDFRQTGHGEDCKNLSIQDSCVVNETESDISIPSSKLECTADLLRKKLVEKGFFPGPITTTTKKIYLKKLIKLEKRKNETHHTSAASTKRNTEKVYSPELQKTLNNFSWQNQMTECMLLEKSVVQQFTEKNNKKNWREGISKSSFVYILLDPRITSNLPYWASFCANSEAWTKFLSAVFYIGKGKRSRPYMHLYEAFAYWKKNCYSSIDDKVQYILDIWKDGLGVICLHVFQHVIPVEAYTREAAMIDAVGLRNLKNSRSGDYYGIAATWTSHQKRKWGTYLLYRAFCIFLFDGERQLRPSDVAS